MEISTQNAPVKEPTEGLARYFISKSDFISKSNSFIFENILNSVKITESDQNDQNDSTVEPPKGKITNSTVHSKWKSPLICWIYWKGYFGTRHVFGLMAFIGMVIAYMLRVNLSVAIVVMVNRTRTSEPDSYSSYSSVIQGASNSSSVCPSSGDQPTQDNVKLFIITHIISYSLSHLQIYW